MNKILTIAGLALAGIALTGCDDFLDDNRYPLTSLINSPEYWSTPSNCQLQCDRNLDFMPAYGTGAGQNGWFYFKTLSDDQVGASFANWTYTSDANVPDWYSTYQLVRSANYIINGVRSSSLLTSDKLNYEAIGRLQRAIAYYRLVRMFGDVVWEDVVIAPEDKDVLYGPRTDRDKVMDYVLEDLDFAIANIATEKSLQSWSKDLARAIKSEVTLYEGTFCKYRTQADNGKAPDMTRAEKWLRECASVSEQLLGKYGFRTDFKSLYNSTWNESAGINDTKIPALSANPELIFGREYNQINGRNSLISFTASSTTTSGMSLDAFNAFLFKDGLPKALTSMNTSLEGVAEPAGLSIENLLQMRDDRLAATTDDHVYYQNMTWSRAGTTGMNSSSGFGVAKYDNINLPVNDRQNSSQNYTSAPLYWTSYIACNYAEAKTELGSFDQAAFDKSLKALYERAGLTTITGPAVLEAINDPDNNMGVSSLLWEVRRCRRCELMFDNWIRYWDLVRWHQLELLDNQKHPDVLLGAYMVNSPVPIANVNGYVDGSKGMRRTYEAKYYLYPIPADQLSLNPDLGKNPGW